MTFISIGVTSNPRAPSARMIPAVYNRSNKKNATKPRRGAALALLPPSVSLRLTSNQMPCASAKLYYTLGRSRTVTEQLE